MTDLPDQDPPVPYPPAYFERYDPSDDALFYEPGRKVRPGQFVESTD